MQIPPTLSKASNPADQPPDALASRASLQGKRDAGYPAHVAGSWQASNGASARIRPIAAEDAGMIRDFVQSLSLETRYLRFLSAVNELSPQTIARLTSIDHRRDAALIAISDQRGASRVVGVARYALDAGGESCEFAIVVADDWRSLGLGRWLMKLLVDTAAARGLKRMRGEVLAINGPMLAFAKALGFSASVSNDDPTMRRVELRIARRVMIWSGSIDPKAPLA